MAQPRFIRLRAPALVAGALMAATLLGPARLPAEAAHSRAAYPPLTIWSFGASLPFTRDFNLCTGSTAGGAGYDTVFEPLYVTDDVNYKQYPWLATSYTWSKDLKTLTFTIRQGVRWSDGVPFTAKDVLYTLWTLPKKFPSCDWAGLTSAASSVTMPSPDQVAIHYKTADNVHFWTLCGSYGSVILPEHIYAKVKNPATWQNPNPVGTGPFTRVLNFTAQSFDLGKNPYYWRPMDPKFTTIRITDFTNNDAGNLALEAGQVDWGGSILPNVSKIYDARNPNFHHLDYPGYADIMLFPNDAKYPFSLPVFRKALSMAINRQAVDVNADFGYQPPATITGLDPWKSWIDKSIPNTDAQYNPTGARALLKSAGFTWNGSGQLIDPRGHKVAFTLMPNQTGNTFPADAQIMAQNFRALGMAVDVTILQGAAVTARAEKGDFDLEYDITNGGPTPYSYFYPILSSANYKPIGTATLVYTNYERWKDPEMDRLLSQFDQTLNPARQHELMDQIQQIFVQNLPAIPVVQEAIPGEYNTTNYTGFPTAQDVYAQPQPYAFYADTLLILTRIHTTH